MASIFCTGEICSDDCILNDVKIVRTLYAVCDILKNSAPAPVRAKKSERVSAHKTGFLCPIDLLDRFEYKKEMSLLKMIYRIARLYPQMKRLQHTVLIDALINKGILDKLDYKDGSYRLVPTDLHNNKAYAL